MHGVARFLYNTRASCLYRDTNNIDFYFASAFPCLRQIKSCPQYSNVFFEQAVETSQATFLQFDLPF